MRLKLKMILILEVALLLLVLALLMPFRNQVHGELIEGLQHELRAIAATAALQIDGDLHKTIRSPDDAEKPAFTQLRQKLIEVRDANHLTEKQIYTFYRDGPNVRFAVMTHPQPFVGDPYALRMTMLMVLQDGVPRATGLYSDEHGAWISAYAPIRDAAGQAVGLLAVDRLASTYVERAWQATLWLLIIAVNGLVAASVIGVYVLNKVIIRPTKALHDGMRALGRRDFQHRVKINTRDEFQDLAQTFNHLSEQLNIASEIQAGFSPKQLPQLDFCRLAGFSEPCEATGGDYYDAFVLDGGRLGVVVADVTGHGIGPSLLMAACRASLRALSRTDLTPAELIAELSELVAEDMEEGRFITMIYGILDAAGTFTYANAGHGPAMVFLDGAVHTLRPHHPPLGIFIEDDDDDCPPQSSLRLAPGDRILLASDGLSESLNEQGEQFGNQRIAEIGNQRDLTPTPEEAIGRLKAALDEHCGSYRKLDDVTILCVDRV